jgi:hypothetical protein
LKRKLKNEIRISWAGAFLSKDLNVPQDQNTHRRARSIQDSNDERRKMGERYPTKKDCTLFGKHSKINLSPI